MPSSKSTPSALGGWVHSLLSPLPRTCCRARPAMCLTLLRGRLPRQMWQTAAYHVLVRAAPCGGRLGTTSELRIHACRRGSEFTSALRCSPSMADLGHLRPICTQQLQMILHHQVDLVLHTLVGKRNDECVAWVRRRSDESLHMIPASHLIRALVCVREESCQVGRPIRDAVVCLMCGCVASVNTHTTTAHHTNTCNPSASLWWRKGSSQSRRPTERACFV